jgi:hypothetical protein
LKKFQLQHIHIVFFLLLKTKFLNTYLCRTSVIWGLKQSVDVNRRDQWTLLLKSRTAVSRLPPNILVHMVSITASFGGFGFKSCVKLGVQSFPTRVLTLRYRCVYVLLSHKKLSVQKTFK